MEGRREYIAGSEGKEGNEECKYAPSLPVTAATWTVGFFTARQTEGVLRGADHHLWQRLLHDRETRKKREDKGRRGKMK
jgi:hypothetical protein